VQLNYTRRAVPGGVLLRFYSVEVTSLKDGRVVEREFMSHAKMIEQSGSQVREMSYDQFAPEQKERFDAAFGTDHAKILLDDDLNETGCEFFSAAGRRVINRGLLDCTRLVHGPYFLNQTSWTSVRRIPMTMGLILDCSVQYTKHDRSDGKVKVTGSLSKKETRSETSDVVLRNVSIRLSGEESFDHAVGDYTGGELALDYSFDVTDEDGTSENLRGAMAVTLERLMTNK
jgi:hypothetical protein